MPAQFVFYVHCPQCGNLDLQRVSRERVVEDLFAPLKRAARVPAYRCDPCRLRFFSVLPFRRIPALRLDPSPTDSQDS